jgi:hypothetical protein
MRAMLLSASLAGLVTALPARAENVACAPGTAWDGMACAHARATCGAWDGTTCEPGSVDPQRERALRAEFSRIDADAGAICAEDAAQVYPGPAVEVMRAVDTDLKRADAIDRRLEDLRNRADSPEWSIATFARAGSLYDCIWSSLASATPAYFTAAQQAKVNQLKTLNTQLPSQLQAAIDDTEKQVEQKWLDTRDRYIDAITRKMVIRYATAALLARRYAIEGFALTHAYERLPFAATALGPQRMAGILATLSDPTDPTGLPEGRRHVLYVQGAFDR